MARGEEALRCGLPFRRRTDCARGPASGHHRVPQGAARSTDHNRTSCRQLVLHNHSPCPAAGVSGGTPLPPSSEQQSANRTRARSNTAPDGSTRRVSSAKRRRHAPFLVRLIMSVTQRGLHAAHTPPPIRRPADEYRQANLRVRSLFDREHSGGTADFLPSDCPTCRAPAACPGSLPGCARWTQVLAIAPGCACWTQVLTIAWPGLMSSTAPDSARPRRTTARSGKICTPITGRAISIRAAGSTSLRCSSSSSSACRQAA